MMNRRAFSLIELLIVMAIIGLLVTMSVPNFQKMIERARSTGCLSNLRQIGATVRLYANDNDNTFPVIEMDPDNNIYPEDVGAKPMLETLAPYGLDAKTVRCASDVAAQNYYAQKGNSYQWLPRVDDENALAPLGYRRDGNTRVLKPSRVSLATDYVPVHSGKSHRVYADGHAQ